MGRTTTKTHLRSHLKCHMVRSIKVQWIRQAKACRNLRSRMHALQEVKRIWGKKPKICLCNCPSFLKGSGVCGSVQNALGLGASGSLRSKTLWRFPAWGLCEYISCHAMAMVHAEYKAVEEGPVRRGLSIHQTKPVPSRSQ